MISRRAQVVPCTVVAAPAPLPAEERAAEPPLTVAVSLLVAYLGALALAEWVLTASVPAAAGCFGLLAIAACFAPFLDPFYPPASPGAAAQQRRGAALLPVLVAMPVARLIVLATPTADIGPLSRLGLLAVPTMVAVMLAARACPPDWRLLRPSRTGPAPGGWRGGWPAQAAIPLVALPLGLAVYWLAPPTPPLGGHTPVVIAGAVLALAVIPDELLFRGLLVRALVDITPRAAVPLAAAAYAGTFIAYGSARVVAAAFVVGFVLGWLRRRTDCAIGVLGARVLLVWLVYLVLPACTA
jgi:membrane protease YdiL (CAAX protease family)